MLDEQYVKIMGGRLERFRPIGRNKYECRCPLCGDSKKDKKKARGNFYVWKGDWMFKCHNCGKAHRIPTLLEICFPDLFEEYIMGKTRNRMTGKAKKNTTQKAIISTTRNPIKTKKVTINLPSIASLADDHPAVSYIRKRKIPTKYWTDLYYVEQFKNWSNSVVPGAFSEQGLKFDDARIVIPFREKDGTLFAFQGRALKKSKLKYLTVKINHDKQKIYGLDRLTNPDEEVLVVEGPIDSMFLDNCIGTADSSLDSLQGMFDNMVYIWDNEARSKQIVKKMEAAIEKGAAVVIWKKSNKFNDINDAVENFGYTEESINELVKRRTYNGLSALLELNNWRKC